MSEDLDNFKNINRGIQLEAECCHTSGTWTI